MTCEITKLPWQCLVQNFWILYQGNPKAEVDNSYQDLDYSAHHKNWTCNYPYLLAVSRSSQWNTWKISSKVMKKIRLFLHFLSGNILLVTCYFNSGRNVFSFIVLHLSSLCIQVTRVENTSTTSEAQALGPKISKQTVQPPKLETRSCPGIEERLRNVETHFGYGPGIV